MELAGSAKAAVEVLPETMVPDDGLSGTETDTSESGGEAGAADAMVSGQTDAVSGTNEDTARSGQMTGRSVISAKKWTSTERRLYSRKVR